MSSDVEMSLEEQLSVENENLHGTVSDLEEQLAAVTRERDALLVRIAELEAGK